MLFDKIFVVALGEAAEGVSGENADFVLDETPAIVIVKNDVVTGEATVIVADAAAFVG